jgi:hypothetical protein
VRLCGAVDTIINDTTYLLRDAHGLTLVNLLPASLAKFEVPKDVKPIEGSEPPPSAPPPFRFVKETIVGVEGVVAARAKPDSAAPTGAVQVNAASLTVETE